MRLKGFFGVRLIDAATGRIRYASPDLESNLIVNQGVYRMGTGIFFTHCHVGTGSVAPTVTDTSLTSFLAYTPNVYAAANGVQTTTLPYYGWRRLTFSFDAGTVVGNISELATAWGAAQNTIFSKSLIKDNGVPITLSVTSTDILQVVYELRNYTPETDLSFSAVIAGVLTDCVARPSYIGTTWGLSTINTFFGSADVGYSTAYESDVLGTITSGPTGLNANCSHTVGTYTANTTSRPFTLDFSLSQGNFPTGIGSVLCRNTLGHWQVSFSPKIQKTATKTLALNFQSTWGRA